jgi:hypothetical protein
MKNSHMQQPAKSPVNYASDKKTIPEAFSFVILTECSEVTGSYSSTMISGHQV